MKKNVPIDFAEMEFLFHFQNQKLFIYVRFYLLNHLQNFENKSLCILDTKTCRNLKSIKFANFLSIICP